MSLSMVSIVSWFYSAHMHLDEIIKKRRSIRKFKDRRISRKTIDSIIEAGTYAPTACNMQMWHFIVIDDNKTKEKLCAKASSPSLIKNSAFTVFVLYDKKTTYQRYANIQSAAAAIQNMLLKAYSMGIGSNWMTAFGNEEKIREILKTPSNYILIAAVCFGYPDENPRCPSRRENVISYNRFEQHHLYPDSFNPEKWTIEQIRDYHSFKIRAKSPSSPLHNPIFDDEFRKILDKIELYGDVLDIFPYFGNYTQMILFKNRFNCFTIYEMSDEVIDFLKWKFNSINKKIKFIKGLDEFPIENNSFDVIICFNTLEKIPEPEKVINEAYRVLRKNGTFYLFFTNKMSYYGIIHRLYSFVKGNKSLLSMSKKYFYSIYLRFRSHSFQESIIVPFKPISYLTIRKFLKNFKIEILNGNIFSKNILIKAVKR